MFYGDRLVLALRRRFVAADEPVLDGRGEIRIAFVTRAEGDDHPHDAIRPREGNELMRGALARDLHPWLQPDVCHLCRSLARGHRAHGGSENLVREKTPSRLFRADRMACEAEW